MRDVFIEGICDRMQSDKNIFFLCADFGSPKLDALRKSFKDRFINVGIAEQNLINISTGLALEGYTVYAYAIAPFLIMRAYEQIRVNLSLHAQHREVNINLIGVGAGLSYDVSGPTHHCLEDISIMRTLPHCWVFSPSDWIQAQKFIDLSIHVKMPKYLRFDGKPLPSLYFGNQEWKIDDGVFELKKGEEFCFVSTGFMTHTALKAAEELLSKGLHAGVIDVFLLKPANEDLILSLLNKYKYIVTLEEGFIKKGGLDSLIAVILEKNKKKGPVLLKRMGFDDRCVFDIGNRSYLHKLNGLDESAIARKAFELLGEAHES